MNHECAVFTLSLLPYRGVSSIKRYLETNFYLCSCFPRTFVSCVLIFVFVAEVTRDLVQVNKIKSLHHVERKPHAISGQSFRKDWIKLIVPVTPPVIKPSPLNCYVSQVADEIRAFAKVKRIEIEKCYV